MLPGWDAATHVQSSPQDSRFTPSILGTINVLSFVPRQQTGNQQQMCGLS